MSGEFKKSTIEILRKRAGEMCTICKRLTAIPTKNPKKYANLGQAAHIIGQKDFPDKRHIQNLTPKQISSIENAIWLCGYCHKKIDSDEIYYPIEELLEIKQKHESDIINGKLNYSKFKEYQKMEFEIYYLHSELEKSKSEKSLFIQKIDTLEDEKQGFIEKIDGIESTLHNSKINYNEAKKCFFEKHDLEATLKYINDQELINEEQMIAEKRLLFAQVKEAQGKTEEANKSYKKSIKIFPYLDNLYYYGKCLFNNNELTKALNVLQMIVYPEGEELKNTILNYDVVSKFCHSHMFLSRIYKAFNHFEKAANSIDVALGLLPSLVKHNSNEVPRYLTAITLHGNLLCDEDRYKEALYYYEKSFELAQKIYSSDSHQLVPYLANIGITYHNLNDKNKSNTFLSKALEITSNSANKSEDLKSNHAKLSFWLFRITSESHYIKKSYELYSELTTLNFNNYIRDKLIVQLDYGLTLKNNTDRLKCFSDALLYEQELIDFDSNIYEKFFGNLCRLYALDLSKSGDSIQALSVANKAVQHLEKASYRNEKLIQEFILVLNLRIDLIVEVNNKYVNQLTELEEKEEDVSKLEKKTAEIKEETQNIQIQLKKDILKFEKLFLATNFSNSTFIEVFEFKLGYCKELLQNLEKNNNN